MANIQKRKNKNKTYSYKVQIRLKDGLPPKTFPTKEEAKDWARQEEVKRRQGIYLKKNKEIEEDIRKLELQRIQNMASDELNAKICSIPQDSDIDKIMKYEKSIQKSIFQNLLLLKKLQHEF
ncbi:MAG: hypothetical protein ACFFG0_17905 [Candidatus Thorarchaeota archaeon]